MVGLRVEGLSVGDPVELAMGDPVGNPVGLPVRLAVGNPVGTDVGAPVGLLVVGETLG